MVNRIKKTIQIYNQHVARNTAIVFILVIYFSSKSFFDFNVKENIFLTLLIFTISIILGTILDYIIFRYSARLIEYSAQEKRYIKYAYFLLAILLIIIASIVVLALKLIF